MREKGWKVKIERPEEIHKHPEVFYTPEEVERYSKSSSMKKIQQKITSRALELLGLEKGKILDIGCGPGFSMQYLKDNGFEVIGIDVVKNMLNKAKEKGLNVIKADIRDMPFEDNSFDGIISISALQWLLTDKEKTKNIRKAAKETKRVLKHNGKAVFQFYPKSEELIYLIGKIFAETGFRGQFVIDNADNPKKRRIFLVVEKS